MIRIISIAAAASLLALATQPAAAAVGDVNGKIAFERDGRIYTVNPDATNERLLLSGGGNLSGARFSPDGTKILLVAGGEDQSSLQVADAVGTNRVTIKTLEGSIGSAEWSADGTRIFYAPAGNGETPGEIDAITPDGSAEVMITAAGPSSGLFSIGGERIAFTEAGEIFVINTDGTGRTQLTNDPAADNGPVVSHDGSRIAWTTERHNPPDEFSVDSEIYIIDSDGTNQARLTTSNVANVAAAFPPDDSLLGYDRDGHAAVMGVDGGDQRVLPAGNNFNYFGDFSPSGQTVVFNHILPLPGEDDPTSFLGSVGVDGSDRSELTSTGVPLFFSDWQAVTEPIVDPPLALELQASPEQRSDRLKVKATCSNECDLRVVTKMTVDGELVKARLEEHLIGNQKTVVRPLSSRPGATLAGERGRATLTVRATDDFGGLTRERIEIRLTA